ncbi:AraC family transcriptional regulator [Sorangium sp. So ce1389]|uniref:AraC family transcriptional regulator n=1 Tax=Sorangium sp. So ce1389 TaxID=3133336 RepID=UPI003F63C13C
MPNRALDSARDRTRTDSPATMASREVCTADPSEAEVFMQRLHPGTKLEPLSREAFSCELRVTGAAPATFVRGSCRGGARIRFDHLEDLYGLTTSTEGMIELSHKGERLGAVPERRALLLSPGLSGSFQTDAVVRARSVVFDAAALPAHVAALAGRAPQDPIVFAPALSLESGPGALVRDLVQVCFHALEQPGTSLLLLASLRDSLLTALLTGLPHNASHLFERPAASASRRCVRRAEEFIAAHAAEELTVARIAEAAGVPVRSLQIAFRAAHGMTPMEFARERRFDLARRELLEGAPGTTVMDVLASLGLGSSPGRFSVEYRRRFGESPSDTLAAARARRGG